MRSLYSFLSLAALAFHVPAYAQASDAARLYPIQGEIRDAGVYDIATGRWLSRGAPHAALAPFSVYDNTCTWTGGASFLALQPCEEVFDEGRIPSELNGGTLTKYDIDTIEIAYCTFVPSGSVDIDFSLIDTSAAPTMCTSSQPPSNFPAAWQFDSSANGFPLPGSVSAGTQACWSVTFSNGSQPLWSCASGSATASEHFYVTARNHNTAAQGGGQVGGPVIAGEPTIAPGSGTFSNPPGVDPITGLPCGTGLSNDDSFWINIDNTAVGGTPSCAGAHANGTNCYSFGYPSGAFAGIHLRLGAPGVGTTICDCDFSYAHYCTAKPNSLGCTSSIQHFGCTQFAAPLELVTPHLLGNKSAIYFWGKSGLQGVPFQGGFLCVKPPTIRTPPQNTGGHAGQCDGSLTLDITPSLMANHAVAGSLIGVQCWSRDPAASFGTGLSSAVSFVLLP